MEEGEFLEADGSRVASGRAGRGTPCPSILPLRGEMGGADRETGRKPLWGSIVL